jgi:hypothetical protein
LSISKQRLKTKFAPQDFAVCSVENTPKNVAAPEALLLYYRDTVPEAERRNKDYL